MFVVERTINISPNVKIVSIICITESSRYSLYRAGEALNIDAEHIASGNSNYYNPYCTGENTLLPNTDYLVHECQELIGYIPF